MKSLYERMVEVDMHQCRKHGLHDDPEEYAHEQLDQMSNTDLVKAMSEHMEDMFKEFARSQYLDRPY